MSHIYYAQKEPIGGFTMTFLSLFSKIKRRPFKISRFLSLIYFTLRLFYMECIFRIFITELPLYENLGFILLVSMTVGAVFSLICSIFNSRMNQIIAIVLSGAVFLLYASQTVYVSVFHTPFVISSISGAGQVLQFMDIILSTIWDKLAALLLMAAAPMTALILFARLHIPFQHYPIKWLPFFVLEAVIPMALIFLLLGAGGRGVGSPYDIFYHERPGTLVLNRFGLLTCTKNDIKALILPDSASIENFDFATLGEGPGMTDTENNRTPSFIQIPDDSTRETDTLTAETAIKESETEAKPIVPNVMDIDFQALAQTETDEIYRTMDLYFSTVEPTYTNEYTGLFEGYNLIFLTAESFSPYVIDPELTPTLYRLSHEGFIFNNFYNPVWGVSTSDGEYVNCQSLVPKSGVWSMYKSGDNWLPFTMGNQFLNLNYATYAYHNHTYDYYSRDISHPNLGYTYKGLGQGLEVEEVWPESDLEMMELTIPEYINEDHFSIYYMTVSGHMPYGWGNNAMAAKHKEAVAQLPYSDTVKGYIACNIELDHALAYLLEELEKAGQLERTVICLGADHYPYGLEQAQLEELAGHEIEKNFELYKSTLILWNAKMAENEPIVIDKYCSSMDILPTLSNLFGLTYDSRLMMGRDILSDSPPLVMFSNKSWITDRAMYNAQTGSLSAFHPEDTIPDTYIQMINEQVSQKFTFSTYILDYDYYRHLFPEGYAQPQIEPQSGRQTDEQTNEQTDASAALQ